MWLIYFESYYEIVDKFNRDCRLDVQKILYGVNIWRRK